jgi:phosphatidate cytidylyltransferase
VALIARQGFGVGWLYSILIPLVSAVAGTFGDLLESKLKRLAGVKDSGNMMPGHGGFLDRFDSMLLATPVVWLFLQVFG